MTTMGAILIVIGSFVIQRVLKGRAGSLLSDARDILQGVLTGDYDQVSSVLALGESTGTTGDSSDPGTTGGDVPTAGGTDLLSVARAKGDAAQGYRLGSTGPSTYDCSGLVWDSMRELGYDVDRFTTSTFTALAKSGIATEVTAKEAAPGDIVLWSGHHMGVMDGKTSFYSALSSRSGIRSAPLDWIDGTPSFWRLNAAKTPVRSDDGNNPVGA